MLMFLEPIPVFLFILIFLLFLPIFFPYFQDSELAFLIVIVGWYYFFLSFTHDHIGILGIPIHRCDPGHSFCYMEGFSIVRFPFVIRR
jgi:hypothetical protein